MKSKLIALAAMMAISPFAAAGDQDVFITEFMYTGLFGEFIELANTGSTAVDIEGWVVDDNSSDFHIGTLLAGSSTVMFPGDTIVITEVSQAVFVQAWFIDAGHVIPAELAAIVENNSNNLGRADEIHIYEDNGVLVDHLTYDDQAPAGYDKKGPRTENVSAVPGPLTVLGNNLFKNWVLSAEGAGNAWKAAAPAPVPGPVGSPGQYPN